MLEGQVIHIIYKGMEGKKALYNLIVDDLNIEDNFNFVIEPELIDETDGSLTCNYEEFFQMVHHFVKEANELKTLRPPDNLRLIISGDFIIAGEEINSDEYDILSVASDYGKVADIYRESPLCDFEITKALISLRKKKAFKVLKTSP